MDLRDASASKNSIESFSNIVWILKKHVVPDKVVVEEVNEYEFFVLIKRDQAGLNFLQGYWSKNLDKQWSLNTIVIFPHYQFNGYGQLMITFSYLFLKVEGVAGTPERPLCTKGRESFEKFRKASVLKYLRSGWKLDLQEMSLATGIVDEDLLRAMRPRMSVLYRDISRMQYIASFGNIAI